MSLNEESFTEKFFISD